MRVHIWWCVHVDSVVCAYETVMSLTLKSHRPWSRSLGWFFDTQLRLCSESQVVTNIGPGCGWWKPGVITQSVTAWKTDRERLSLAQLHKPLKCSCSCVHNDHTCSCMKVLISWLLNHQTVLIYNWLPNAECLYQKRGHSISRYTARLECFNTVSCV